MEICMNAIKFLARKAYQTNADGHFDAKSTEVVPSPCISVCRMTPDRSHCEGCWRTLDELREWSSASAEERRAIWRNLLARAGINPTLPHGGVVVCSEPSEPQ